MGPVTNLNITPVANPQEALRGVDIVLAATNSSVPVFDGNWLEPGQHVTTIVGSNVGLVKGGFTAAKRREIDDENLARSHVWHRFRSASDSGRTGGNLRLVQRGVIKWEQLVEWRILSGKKEGRTKAEQITFYKNNAGQGVPDVALGALVLEQVRKRARANIERLDVRYESHCPCTDYVFFEKKPNLKLATDLISEAKTKTLT